MRPSGAQTTRGHVSDGCTVRSAVPSAKCEEVGDEEVLEHASELSRVARHANAHSLELGARSQASVSTVYK